MLGRDTRFGFGGNFLIAFLFSPLVGVIALLAAQPPKQMVRRRDDKRSSESELRNRR